MILSLIAAIADNGVIGNNNKLLWHLPNDFAYFKRVTSGHPVIMGRKTFESIGRPLPHRRNIVVTRDTNYARDGIEVVHTFNDAIDLIHSTDEEVFVIGGGELYQQALSGAERLYITEVHTLIQGDTHFPVFDKNLWREVSRNTHPSDEAHLYAYDFVVYEKPRV